MTTLKQIAAVFLIPVALALAIDEAWDEHIRRRRGDGENEWEAT